MFRQRCSFCYKEAKCFLSVSINLLINVYLACYTVN